MSFIIEAPDEGSEHDPGPSSVGMLNDNFMHLPGEIMHTIYDFIT